MLSARPPVPKSPLLATPRNARTGKLGTSRASELLWGLDGADCSPSNSRASVCTSFPSWRDAVAQASVNSSVQEHLQNFLIPRLDSFAERLGDLVASARSEVGMLECLVKRTEARVEERISGLESRVSILAEGAARSEQRDRDLNTRIAGVDQKILISAMDVASDVGLKVRLDDFARRLKEGTTRLNSIEESCRRHRKLNDDRIDKLEESSRTWPKFADGLREVAAATARSVVAAACPPIGQQQVVSMPMEEFERVVVLEDQVRMLRRAIDITAASEQAVNDHIAQSTNDCRSQLISKHEEYKEAIASRIDEISLRVSALKVKADGLDSRLHSGLDRVERVITERNCEQEAAKKLVEVEEQMMKRFGQLSSEIHIRLEAFSGRLDALEETSQEADKHRHLRRQPMLNRL